MGALLRAFLGPQHTWMYRRNGVQQYEDFEKRLADAFSRTTGDSSVCSEEPVFLFSAGWRSGSTLLQRMIMQNNEHIVVWGEPFHLCNIFDGLADQFRAFTGAWPKDSDFLSKRNLGRLSDQWVANLYPDVDDLVKAHRAFLDTCFFEPAKRVGGVRWGMKVVRLNIHHAMYLKRIYPRGKFIFLCRNPFASYASFRTVYDGWFAKWPTEVVSTPYAYGKNWARLASGFFTGHKMIDGLFIRYEDLNNEQECRRLTDYLEWPISTASSLERIVGGLGGPAGAQEPELPRLERMLLGVGAGGVRKMLGY